jgi:hypothetical protein
VTGYQRGEIEAFVERGVYSHLIVDGQPNDDAFQCTENVEEGGDFGFLFIGHVFEGTLERTVDDRYSRARIPLHSETTRWEDDGGWSRHAG